MGTLISGSTGIAKIQNDAVDIADLSATGTASASTFLRGDNSWTAVDALPTQSGNADKFLTTDASTASWTTLDSAQMPAGSVIQTVFNAWSNQVQITSTDINSPTNTGLSCAITPKVAGSKILGMIDIYFMLRSNTSGNDAGVLCKVHDGSSYVFSQGHEAHMGLYTYGGSGDPSDEWRGLQGIKFYINATNTTARTYSVHAVIYPSSGPPEVYAQINGTYSAFTLMEIAV